jgi:hypothetical protein
MPLVAAWALAVTREGAKAAAECWSFAARRCAAVESMRGRDKGGGTSAEGGQSLQVRSR